MITDEAPISPAAACRDPRLCRDGRHISLHKYYWLVNKGARTALGNRVRLETLQTPAGKSTTREAIGRFVVAMNDDKVAPKEPPKRAALPTGKSPHVTVMSHAASVAYLSSVGIAAGGKQ